MRSIHFRTRVVEGAGPYRGLGGSYTSVGEGSPLPRVRKELPQGGKILRWRSE